jgi:putative membrane protein
VLFLALVARAAAHQGLVLPWDTDAIDYTQADPDAWKVLDLHASVVLGIAAFCWLYGRAVTTWRVRYGWSDRPIEAWRVTCFAVAQVVLLASLNGPLHHLSDYFLFSAHMVQHLLLNMVWAPLTVLALPPWLIEAALQRPRVRRVSDFLGRLPVKFLAYNGALYFWHIPFCYDLALRYHPLHIVEHLMFMATSVIASFGLLNSAPSLPRPPRILQMLYLFVMTLPMKLLGALITLSPDILYQGYAAAPRFMGVTPHDDQVWGGVLMWAPGSMMLWGSMIYVFAQWVREERASQRADTAAYLSQPVPLRVVEDER